jgi:hypothetical protein
MGENSENKKPGWEARQADQAFHPGWGGELLLLFTGFLFLLGCHVCHLRSVLVLL